jgi:hypothetical protein
MPASTEPRIVLILLGQAPLTTAQPAWEMTELMRILAYASLLAGLRSFVLSGYLVMKRSRIRNGSVVQLNKAGPFEGCYVTVPTPFAGSDGFPIDEAALGTAVLQLLIPWHISQRRSH